MVYEQIFVLISNAQASQPANLRKALSPVPCKRLIIICVQTVLTLSGSSRTQSQKRRNGRSKSQYLARPLLSLLDLLSWYSSSFGFIARLLHLNSSVYSKLENFGDTFLLFCRAFDISCVHLSCNSLALFWCHWRKTLCSQELDAGALIPEIGFEADEDERGGWAEMKNFWVPLRNVSSGLVRNVNVLALSITFSKELGQSIAKQTNSRSVSG